MKEIIAIFIGGGLGSLTRYGLGKWINGLHNVHFPLGTLVTNIVACFALGLIIGLADHKQLLSPVSRLFWTIGFCGGFSTFSAFSSETITLIQQGHYASMTFYVLASVFLCIAVTFCGLLIATRI